MAEPLHPADALPADVSREQGPKPVAPQPDRFVAQVNATLEEQVLDVPQRQRKPHVHQDHEPDHLG